MSIKSNIVARTQSIAAKVKPHAVRAGEWMLAHPHTVAATLTGVAVLTRQHRINNDVEIQAAIAANPTSTKIAATVGVIGIYWSTYDMVKTLNEIHNG